MALPRGYRKWAKPKRSRYWANKRQGKKNLLNPRKPLAGANLLSAARATVDLETQPQITALDQQARSTRIQQGALASRAGGYYSQLAKEAAGDVARIQATRETTRGALQGIAAQGQQNLDRTQAVADEAQARD